MDKRLSEVDALKRAVELAKKQADAIKKKEAEDAEKARLTKELKQYQREANPTFRKMKAFGHSVGNILDNIETNRGKDKSGCEINDKVMITNGSYAGKVITITKFIVGGIEGDLNGNILRIRHGSYYKVIEDG